MMQVTIKIKQELAHRLRPRQGHLLLTKEQRKDRQENAWCTGETMDEPQGGEHGTSKGDESRHD